MKRIRTLHVFILLLLLVINATIPITYGGLVNPAYQPPTILYELPDYTLPGRPVAGTSTMVVMENNGVLYAYKLVGGEAVEIGYADMYGLDLKSLRSSSSPRYIVLYDDDTLVLLDSEGKVKYVAEVPGLRDVYVDARGRILYYDGEAVYTAVPPYYVISRVIPVKMIIAKAMSDGDMDPGFFYTRDQPLSELVREIGLNVNRTVDNMDANILDYREGLEYLFLETPGWGYMDLEIVTAGWSGPYMIASLNIYTYILVWAEADYVKVYDNGTIDTGTVRIQQKVNSSLGVEVWIDRYDRIAKSTYYKMVHAGAVWDVQTYVYTPHHTSEEHKRYPNWLRVVGDGIDARRPFILASMGLPVEVKIITSDTFWVQFEEGSAIYQFDYKLGQLHLKRTLPSDAIVGAVAMDGTIYLAYGSPATGAYELYIDNPGDYGDGIQAVGLPRGAKLVGLGAGRNFAGDPVVFIVYTAAGPFLSNMTYVRPLVAAEPVSLVVRVVDQLGRPVPLANTTLTVDYFGVKYSLPGFSGHEFTVRVPAGATVNIKTVTPWGVASSMIVVSRYPTSDKQTVNVVAVVPYTPEAATTVSGFTMASPIPQGIVELDLASSVVPTLPGGDVVTVEQRGGMIYVSRDDGLLTAYNSLGQEAWRIKLPVAPQGILPAGGYIVAYAPGGVYVVDTLGNMLFSYTGLLDGWTIDVQSGTFAYWSQGIAYHVDLATGTSYAVAVPGIRYAIPSATGLTVFTGDRMYMVSRNGVSSEPLRYASFLSAASDGYTHAVSVSTGASSYTMVISPLLGIHRINDAPVKDVRTMPGPRGAVAVVATGSNETTRFTMVYSSGVEPLSTGPGNVFMGDLVYAYLSGPNSVAVTDYRGSGTMIITTPTPPTLVAPGVEVTVVRAGDTLYLVPYAGEVAKYRLRILVQTSDGSPPVNITVEVNGRVIDVKGPIIDIPVPGPGVYTVTVSGPIYKTATKQFVVTPDTPTVEGVIVLERGSSILVVKVQDNYGDSVPIKIVKLSDLVTSEDHTYSGGGEGSVAVEAPWGPVKVEVVLATPDLYTEPDPVFTYVGPATGEIVIDVERRYGVLTLSIVTSDGVETTANITVKAGGTEETMEGVPVPGNATVLVELGGAKEVEATLVVEAEGYKPVERTVVLSPDGNLSITLERLLCKLDVEAVTPAGSPYIGGLSITYKTPAGDTRTEKIVYQGQPVSVEVPRGSTVEIRPTAPNTTLVSGGTVECAGEGQKARVVIERATVQPGGGQEGQEPGGEGILGLSTVAMVIALAGVAIAVYWYLKKRGVIVRARQGVEAPIGEEEEV